MPPWLISISSSRVLSAIGALGIWLSSDAGERARAIDVRPGMALDLHIEGADLDLALPQRQRDSVLQLLRDSIPAVLERNIGFLDWRDLQAQATDTLEVRWRQREREPHDAMLHFTLRGPHVPQRITAEPLQFMRWETMLDREWRPRAVSREWSAVMDSILKKEQVMLVGRLFGRMPLQVSPLEARVKPLGSELKVLIQVRPDQIRAASDPQPEFLLRVKVRDPRPPTSIAVASLKLRGCSAPDGPPAYVCQMSEFVYLDDTTSAAERRDVLARAELIPLSLHLTRYSPSPFGTGVDGTVVP
jgi:hypothetical protein